MDEAYMGRVLAITPMHCGYGFAVFDTAGRLIKSGVQYVQHGQKVLNRRSMRCIVAHLDQQQPDFVVIECHEDRSSKRSTRVRNLCKAISRETAERGSTLARITRADIKATFSIEGTVTRYQIAQAVVKRFDELSLRLPEKSVSWKSVPCVMAMFDAVALGVVFFERLAES